MHIFGIPKHILGQWMQVWAGMGILKSWIDGYFLTCPLPCTWLVGRVDKCVWRIHHDPTTFIRSSIMLRFVANVLLTQSELLYAKTKLRLPLFIYLVRKITYHVPPASSEYYLIDSWINCCCSCPTLKEGDATPKCYIIWGKLMKKFLRDVTALHITGSIWWTWLSWCNGKSQFLH